MEHRTGIAGSVGCGRGQVSPGHDGICRDAPKAALLEKNHSPETSACSYFGGKKCSRRVMTAVRSVHGIYVETLVPMSVDIRIAKGRDDNAIQQT
jgi:hypothetical protein